MTNLESLNLDSCRIGDEGLVNLTGSCLNYVLNKPLHLADSFEIVMFESVILVVEEITYEICASVLILKLLCFLPADSCL